MHQKKLDKPSANFTFLRLESSLNGTLRVIFWRQRIEAKLVCGGSSVWSIAGGGTGDIHLSFCGSRARSWCGIISYQGKGATLLTKGQTNQNRSSRLFSKSVFPDMSWQFHTVAIFPSHGMDGTQIWIKFDNFVCQAESPMDRKQGGSGFQNILVGQTGVAHEDIFWRIFWRNRGGPRGDPRVDGSSSASGSSQCQPRDKLLHAVIITVQAHDHHHHHHHQFLKVSGNFVYKSSPAKCHFWYPSKYPP